MSAPVSIYWRFEHPSNLSSSVPAEIIWDPVAQYSDPSIAVNIWLIRHDEHAEAQIPVYEMVLIAGNTTASDTIIWTPESTEVNAVASNESVSYIVSQMGMETFQSNPSMKAITNRMDKFSTGFVINVSTDSATPVQSSAGQTSSSTQSTAILPTAGNISTNQTSPSDFNTTSTTTLQPYNKTTSTFNITAPASGTNLDTGAADSLHHTRNLIIGLSSGLGALTVLFAVFALYCYWAARRKQTKGLDRKSLRSRDDEESSTNDNAPQRPVRSPWPWSSKLDSSIWKNPMASAKLQSVAAAEVVAARNMYRV